MKTAENTPATLAAPSEREWLERLTLAAERVATALESFSLFRAMTDPAAPRPIMLTRGNDGRVTLPPEPVACAPVCRTENLHTTSDGSELVCAICSSRQRIEKVATCESPSPAPPPVATAPLPSPPATASPIAPPPAASPAPAASTPTSSSSSSSSSSSVAPAAAAPEPTPIGAQLAETVARRDERLALIKRFPDFGARLADLGDDEVDQGLAKLVKDMSVALLTEPEFNAIRDRMGFKGRWPTGRELRTFCLVELDAELKRREASMAEHEGEIANKGAESWD